MNDKLNCPNCGAVITGDKCEYCGTIFKQEKITPRAKIKKDGVLFMGLDLSKGKDYTANAELLEIRDNIKKIKNTIQSLKE